jgi:spore maturation protein CgeB
VATHWHLEPAEHPAFYSANRLTLNVTRQAMRTWGFTPSGRLFEAAACGTPVLSDVWPGLETFFAPGQEILLAETPEQATAALDRDQADLRRIGQAARERVLAEHTGAHRASELTRTCEAAAC